MSSKEETLRRYCTVSGRLSKDKIKDLSFYEISDPNSEKLLEYVEWEDFHKKNSYHNCFAKDSDFYLSMKTKYSLEDLKNSIKSFTSNSNEYHWHLDQMNQNYEKMKYNNLSADEKKACALVLSYYSSAKDNSDRISKNENILIRGENNFTKIEKWNDGKKFYPVIYYMTKALANLPFYFGCTVRCVNVNDSVLQLYEPGTVITWLQFSNSKVGTKPAPYFETRNTWFFIYYKLIFIYLEIIIFI